MSVIREIPLSFNVDSFLWFNRDGLQREVSILERVQIWELVNRDCMLLLIVIFLTLIRNAPIAPSECCDEHLLLHVGFKLKGVSGAFRATSTFPNAWVFLLACIISFQEFG